MKPAAIGVRAHSGWAVAVAVAGNLTAPQILSRQRIVVIEAEGRRASQPFHYAKDLPLAKAELYLAQCAKTARRLAAAGLENMAETVRNAGHTIIGCGILTASGRSLPALPEILASHPLIHTAEGEFFRNAFADACGHLGLVVSRIRERDLLDRAVKDFRFNARKLSSRLANIGRDLGPPWTQDQKNAALIALVLLGSAGKPGQ